MLLSFVVAGCERRASPAEARKKQFPLGLLATDQAQLLEALGEVLLPGAAAAGLAHFLDQQLQARQTEQVLMLKYLGPPPPYRDFYLNALGAVDQAARALDAKPFAQLAASRKLELVNAMGRGNPPGWSASAPPAPFFHFVLRNDAIDVVYGHPEGFAKLGVPYMAHVLPTTPWPRT